MTKKRIILLTLWGLVLIAQIILYIVKFPRMMAAAAPLATAGEPPIEGVSLTIAIGLSTWIVALIFTWNHVRWWRLLVGGLVFLSALLSVTTLLK